MSRSGRRSDGLAPTLFPFLAVLLCTMGSLVLILMLLVAGAQTSAKEVAAEIDQQFRWEQEKLQLATNKLTKDYENSKLELEKKRLVLQNLENHINELMDELQRLEKTAEQAESDSQNPEETEAERDALREALEKQLADAKQQLDQKLKDPKGDKPIFAIIPYDGPNGTHRRPIYLECTAEGVVVQPEGVVLAPTDLRPPYGPGNPLDAVLRTIRAEFPSQTGSLTSNPYPLLVVRPSGIKNYMMARAAMSGWDDQFGYELVSEDLDLAFPPSTPNLDKKIASAIEMARQRQAALVMSMPQHYDQSQLEFYGDGGGGSGSDGDWNGGSASGSSLGSPSSNGQSSGSGGRGGFSMTGAGQSGQTGLRESSGSTGGGLLSGGGTSADSSWTMAQSATSSSGSSSESITASSGQASGTSGSMSFFGSGGAGDGLLGSAAGTGSDATGSASASSTANAGGTPTGFGSTTGTTGNASTTNSSSSGGGSTSPNTSSSSLANGGAAGSGGTGGGVGSASSNGGSTGTQAGSMQAGGSPASGVSSTSSSGAGSASGSSSTDPAQAGGTPSLNLSYGNNSTDSAKPIAQSKGRDWAWRDGNRSDTAVVRSIRLQCYVDRWVLLPDRGSPSARATVISMNAPPVQRAEQLAQAVIQRVDSWGVALAGGHWAPVLQVEVATNANVQFVQLQRMMEGSGVDVVRKSTISANPNLLQR